MSLDWSTLALQTVNFLVLVWLLQRFLYRPVLAAIDRRRAAATEAAERAAAAERRGLEAEAAWQARTRTLEAEAAERIAAAEAEGQRRAASMLAEARIEADRLTAAARAAIAAERKAAGAALAEHAARVAATLAGRLLAAVAPGVGAAPFLTLLEQRLAALDPAERARFAEGGARVETAPPLSAAEAEAWRRRLAPHLGAVEFVATPELIAGARIASAAAVVEVSWAEALAQARQRMAGDDGTR
ncbi:hypothetical protein [Phaeospirillum tilakii]|uniref:ATP synthase subunit b n=1 Tax=Phaeospirillum tilakii TaxID=741673 RepID=A0ABW5CEJ7_9PROT